jgi:hypothetical protein
MLPEPFGNTHRYLGVAISREFSAVIALQELGQGAVAR